MTADERKKRGEQSAVIVERLVRRQLRAMGCERFDIGIKRDAGEMIGYGWLTSLTSQPGWAFYIWQWRSTPQL